jgi:hypothetical protein
MLARPAVGRALRAELIPEVEALGLPASAVRSAPPAPGSGKDHRELIYFDVPTGDGAAPFMQGGSQYNDVDEWTLDVWFWTRVRGREDEDQVLERCARIGHTINLVLARPSLVAASASRIASSYLPECNVVVTSVDATGRRTGPDLIHSTEGAFALGHIEVSCTAETTFTA